MTWLDDLAEASRSAFWSKPGRLKPGEVPRPWPSWPWPAEPSETNLNKGTNTMTHPLDLAAESASNAGTPATKDLFVRVKDKTKLKDIAILSAKTAYWFSRQMVLKDLALLCAYWLEHLGICDPWQTMREEYDRAKAKHGGMTLDSDKPTDEQRFYAIVEEIGEVARALSYDHENAGELTNEITQLGALALAWLTHENRKEQK